MEARTLCPDVVIVLGEDLTRFRNASKTLYNLLRAFSWNDKVERLGFDEVWLDVTDIVEYNQELLNLNHLSRSFFNLSKTDPTIGFNFDASRYAGYVFPECTSEQSEYPLDPRLRLGSHLALHIRSQLEDQTGYTSTVGISTSRLLSKLVGNRNKPSGQTTLLPPYDTSLARNDNSGRVSNVQILMDDHDIGAVPWIGFKLARKLRETVLGRAADFTTGLVYGGTREAVSVGMVRQLSDLSAERMEKVLAGPGTPADIGVRVFQLLYGVDHTEVAQARNVPRQISIEDSYISLNTMDQAVREMVLLSTRLIQRMRMDLIDDVVLAYPQSTNAAAEAHPLSPRRWMAKPSTVRLTTRPRPPLSPDGTRPRSFNRISRSQQMPAFVFELRDHEEALAERLVVETLLPLFRRLHPQQSGWNLSLVNVGATNMVDTAGDTKSAAGKDIGSMFKMQASKDYVDITMSEPRGEIDEETPSSIQRLHGPERRQSFMVRDDGDQAPSACLRDSCSNMDDAEWDEASHDEEDESIVDGLHCHDCGQVVPLFAIDAHERFHAVDTQ